MAAGRQADGDGPRLFEVGTLVDALVDSEEAPGPLYKFLNLLAVGNGVADDVRLKLVAVDGNADIGSGISKGEGMGKVLTKI